MKTSILSLFLLCLLLTDCAKPEAGSLTGLWQSEEFSTQLGDSRENICLAADGRFSARLQSPRTTLDDSGTFVINGDQVTFSGSNGKWTYRWKRSSDTQLEIFQKNGRPVCRYNRVAPSCDAAPR